jgi:hypothetical protein
VAVAAAQLGFVVVLAVDALVVLVFFTACADHDIIWCLAYFRNSIVGRQDAYKNNRDENNVFIFSSSA